MNKNSALRYRTAVQSPPVIAETNVTRLNCFALLVRFIERYTNRVMKTALNAQTSDRDMTRQDFCDLMNGKRMSISIFYISTVRDA